MGADTLAAIGVAGIGAVSVLAGVVLQRNAANRNADVAHLDQRTEALFAANEQLVANLRTSRDECEAELAKAKTRIGMLEDEVQQLNVRIARLYEHRPDLP